jgi:hypothetical protein
MTFSRSRPDGRSRRGRPALTILAGLIIAVGLAACESMKPTPQQLLVEDAWAACQNDGRIPNQVKLIRVDTDGRYWISGDAGSFGFADTQACMDEKVRTIRR